MVVILKENCKVGCITIKVVVLNKKLYYKV